MSKAMFGNKYKQKPSVYYSRPQGLGMHSPRAFIIAAIAFTIFVLMMVKKLYEFSHSPPRMPEAPMVFDTALPAMPEPNLAQAKPLPGDQEIAQHAEEAAMDVGTDPRLPLPEAGPNAYALAAAEAAANAASA